MKVPDALIHTKLHLPFTRPGLVSRPLLQEKLAKGFQFPLTLVIAPAGFGKTTLVASCINACGITIAWLSLDKDDNQSGRFLTYLVAALQHVDNRIGGEAFQLAGGMTPAPADVVLTSLINDMEIVNAEIALILDDYQLINSQEVHEEMSFLLDHCPKTFHILISSRSDPPLPLARFRARSQVLELRAADLRFTEAEAAQFLNEVMNLDLDNRAVAVLEERTEGWIAGLQMAALSMRDRKDVFAFIEGFSGTNRFILDYLLEEILASQAPEIQNFLLSTSILERMAAPLCDALLENVEQSEFGNEGRESLPGHQFQSQSIPILEYLDRENLFLVSLDDERIWFRYHHLFANLLRARLQQTQPDLVSMLHIRASAWLEQNGYILEAIKHLFAVHEDDRAADLIERYGSKSWADNDPSIMQMADSLPPEKIFARPKIGLYQAWLFIMQGYIGKAIPLLKDMTQHLSTTGQNSGEQWMQTIVSLALAFLAPPGSTSGIRPLPGYQVLDEIPSDEPILRDIADILYGMALVRRGEIDLAAEVSFKSIGRGKKPHEGLTIPTLVSFLSRIYLMQGRLHAAFSLCHEYLDPIKEKKFRFINSGGSSMKIDLGEVLYEWNYLEEAEKQIREGLQANIPWENIMTDSFGLIVLTRVLLGKGDNSGALQTVEKFEIILKGRSRPREFEEEFRTLKTRVHLASGDLQKASDWAEQIIHREDFQSHEELYQLTLAHICLAQGRYAEVEEILSRGTPQLDTGNRISRELESILLRAATYAGQQRLHEAFGLIESCLAMAEPEGYIRSFLDAGEQIRDLLMAYLRTDVPGHKYFCQKVLDAFSQVNSNNSSRSQSSGLIEPLSGREMEVLNLMALGKTNQEIARQLVVARGTIKAHAANIFRKLEATNRTEAVARARRLGFIT